VKRISARIPRLLTNAIAGAGGRSAWRACIVRSSLGCSRSLRRMSPPAPRAASPVHPRCPMDAPTSTAAASASALALGSGRALGLWALQARRARWRYGTGRTSVASAGRGRDGRSPTLAKSRAGSPCRSPLSCTYRSRSAPTLCLCQGFLLSRLASVRTPT
jgi:hypothetical protein